MTALHFKASGMLLTKIYMRQLYRYVWLKISLVIIINLWRHWIHTVLRSCIKQQKYLGRFHSVNPAMHSDRGQSSQKHSLPIAVTSATKPLFATDFLLDSVHGKMQDPESYNIVMWNSTQYPQNCVCCICVILYSHSMRGMQAKLKYGRSKI
jgi:hypothetical protein